MVVGVVSYKMSEFYKVDIGSSKLAILPVLAFEGASRRNRPMLNVGSTVYARVTIANADMEPEIACLNAHEKADGFGELKDGFIIHGTTGLCRSLLKKSCPILEAIGKHFSFEIATGMNGRIWINSTTVKNTIILSNAIQNSEIIKEKDIPHMIKALLKKVDE
jgi:exosome complex component RRP40